jgi:hypothetical protein
MTTETFNIRIENSFKQFILRVLSVFEMWFDFKSDFLPKETFCLIFSKGFKYLPGKAV